MANRDAFYGVSGEVHDSTEQLLRRYQAACRLRSELAEILRDDEAWQEAAAAEADAALAAQLVRAGVW